VDQPRRGPVRRRDDLGEPVDDPLRLRGAERAGFFAALIEEPDQRSALLS
jgi:hypothetical protein